MEITIKEVMDAQRRSREKLDESKNCETCDNDGKTKECADCINSFLGIVFTPSNYIAKASHS